MLNLIQHLLQQILKRVQDDILVKFTIEYGRKE